MARRYRGSSIKRRNVVSIEWDVKPLLDQIEKAGGNVNVACRKATMRSLELVGMHMQLFMMEHRETGDTFNSYDQVVMAIQNNVINGRVGYEIDKGGLPAIFLDVGTPKQKPYFYRYYAVENNRDKIAAIQRETLSEILEGLQ